MELRSRGQEENRRQLREVEARVARAEGDERQEEQRLEEAAIAKLKRTSKAQRVDTTAARRLALVDPQVLEGHQLPPTPRMIRMLAHKVASPGCAKLKPTRLAPHSEYKGKRRTSRG